MFALTFLPLRYCLASDTKLEAGPGILSQEFSDGFGVILTQIWKSMYAASIGYFSEQKYEDIDVDENMFVMIHGMLTYKRLQLGFGASYWENTNRALSHNLNFMEQISIRFYKNWDISYRHWSNGGRDSPNSGQDILSIGYTF